MPETMSKMQAFAEYMKLWFDRIGPEIHCRDGSPEGEYFSPPEQAEVMLTIEHVGKSLGFTPEEIDYISVSYDDDSDGAGRAISCCLYDDGGIMVHDLPSLGEMVNTEKFERLMQSLKHLSTINVGFNEMGGEFSFWVVAGSTKGASPVTLSQMIEYDRLFTRATKYPGSPFKFGETTFETMVSETDGGDLIIVKDVQPPETLDWENHEEFNPETLQLPDWIEYEDYSL